MVADQGKSKRPRHIETEMKQSPLSTQRVMSIALLYMPGTP
jgi:hypothetical protein